MNDSNSSVIPSLYGLGETHDGGGLGGLDGIPIGLDGGTSAGGVALLLLLGALRVEK